MNEMNTTPQGLEDEITQLRQELDTARRSAAELELTEAHFRALLESAPDAIVIVDEQGTITMINSETERLFGYGRDELIGQKVEVLVPDEGRRHHKGHRDRYVHDPHTRPMGHGMALRARRKDGLEFPAEISLSPLESTHGLLVTSVIRDVTDRTRAAEELERQVQRRTSHLNTLLQFSSELLTARNLEDVLQGAINHAMALVTEAQRGVIYLYDEQEQRLALRASAGFEQMPLLSRPTTLGVLGAAFTRRETVITSSVEDYAQHIAGLTPAERELIFQAIGLQSPPTGSVAIPLIAHDTAVGALLLLRVEGAGPFAQDARATLEGIANLAASAILGERSQREAATLSRRLASLEEQQHKLNERLNSAEAGMLQAARLAAVGQLAASIAHEINNPLYAARNCLYLLEEDLPDSLRESPYMAMARDQLARIAGIIERMRDFYRPARGEMASIDINHLLEETLALAGLNLRYGTIRIIFTPTQDLPKVLCNGDQLRQVFLNLVLNAIDAMPDGGTLAVRTLPGPTFALIEIQDTGMGIPEEIRLRMFEPFFTNKPNGTGLGLPISAHIVTQHGGQIEVESHEGQGSTFRVVLPYEPAL